MLQWYQEKLDATIEHEWTVGVFPDLKLAYLSVYRTIGFTQSQSGMIATNLEGLRTTGIGHLFSSSRCRCSSAELNRRVKTFVEPEAILIRIALYHSRHNGNLILSPRH